MSQDSEVWWWHAQRFSLYVSSIWTEREGKKFWPQVFKVEKEDFLALALRVSKKVGKFGFTVWFSHFGAEKEQVHTFH